MKPTKIMLLSLLLLLFLCNTTLAQQSQQKAGSKGGWRVLGAARAQYTTDHDVIYIKEKYTYYLRLKLKITEAPLTLQKMIVRYADGGFPENIDIRDSIPEGGESRVISLNSGKRKIKSVAFWYDTKGFFNGKANVTLFGIK